MRLRDPLRARGLKAWTATGPLSVTHCGDTLHTNLGATGSVTVTLPVGKAKFRARFLRLASQSFIIDPNGTEIIKDATGTSLGAGVAITLASNGAYLELEHDGTSWNVLVQTPESALAALSVGTSQLQALAVTTAKIAAGEVTGAKLSATGLTSGGFTGSNGAGACTLTGATVGQRVLALVETTATVAVGVAAALFESTITIADQIQQSSAANNSAKRYVVILAAVAA